MVIGSSKRVQGTGRNRSVKKANLPRRPSEIEQLWQEIIQPWLWPSLTLGLLFLAIYRHGAETPLNSMLFTALASLMLVLAMVDRNNLVALARLRDWKWAGIGLLAVWIVMIIQLLPIPFFSGNTELWGRKDSVTVDPDLTIRAIVSMGSAVAFFVFGAILIGPSPLDSDFLAGSNPLDFCFSRAPTRLILISSRAPTRLILISSRAPTRLISRRLQPA